MNGVVMTSYRRSDHSGKESIMGNSMAFFRRNGNCNQQVCNDYDNGWLAVVGWPAGQKLSAWLVPDCENSNLRMIARITWGIYI